MSDQNKYDQARSLSEKALEALVEGKEDNAEKFLEQAKAIDGQAVNDVVQELDEDVTSEHDVTKINRELIIDANKP